MDTVKALASCSLIVEGGAAGDQHVVLHDLQRESLHREVSEAEKRKLVQRIFVPGACMVTLDISDSPGLRPALKGLFEVISPTQTCTTTGRPSPQV